tara:strand:+ start:393 stop:554 length:162 start_codon:yes stop_codon:yes gene_type:complete
MKSNKSPWEIMRPTLNKIGYSDEHIDEMTISELSELMVSEKYIKALSKSMKKQ